MSALEAGLVDTVPLLSAAEVFGHALQGETCYLTAPGLGPQPLPVEDWTRAADATDHALLALCDGPTIDLGCGPGRLTAELANGAGQVALGIDISGEAVAQTRRRGGFALRRNVFSRLPGEGRWHAALLADGNIGIGGDPVALLRRVRGLLGPGGRVVVEVAAPMVPATRVLARLECACATSEPFPWAVLGLDDVADVAAAAGLVVTDRRPLGDGRWAAVLQEAAR